MTTKKGDGGKNETRGAKKNDNWVDGKFVCSTCGSDGLLKVSKSDGKPDRIYGKCPFCRKWLGWLDEQEDVESVDSKSKTNLPALKEQLVIHGDNVVEFLELKGKVFEALVMIYMARKDVAELIMRNQGATEELANMKA